MKSYQVLFISLGIVGLIIFYVIWNVGLLKPVTIEKAQVPQLHLLYKKYTGPYQNVGPVFTEVENALAQDKIKCDLTFGRYYDNPNEVEPARNRADIGCIVNSTTPSLPQDSKIQSETLTPYTALEGTFEGAPWLTAFKVYSAIRKESYQRNIPLDENAPSLEIYEKIKHGFKTRVYFKVKEK